MRSSINKNENKGFFNELLGRPTNAKASGVVFTLSSIVPVLFSVLFIIIVGAMGLMSEDVTQKDWYIYSSLLLIQISFLLVVIWYFRWTKKPLKDAIVAQKCHPKYFLWAIVLQFGLMSLSELNGLFLKLLGNIGYEDVGLTLPSMDGFGFFGVFIAVAVLPAILEELIFRGLLLNGLRNFSAAWAVVICGGLFALYHQNPAQTLYQFCCGAAFALVAVKSGSILPTVLAHFINNAVILILTKLGITSFPTPIFIAIIILCSLCLILSLVYLIFLDKNEEYVQRTEKMDKTERRNFWVFASIGMIICIVSWGTVLFSGIAR